MIRYYLRYLDVEHKWVDGTKTTVELMLDDYSIPFDIVLAYVHTNDTIEQCKKREDEFINLMLETIKNNVER